MQRISLLLVSLLFLVLTGCTNETEPAKEPATPQEPTENEQDVVKINDTTFTEKEMDFYALMQKIFIERNRSADMEDASPEEIDDIDSYWDMQRAQYDNVNVKLQTLIELHSMSLLAKEKSYYVPPEDVEDHVQKFNQLIEDNHEIQQLVNHYGRKDYDLEIFPYVNEYLLKQRVLQEIEKDIRSTNTEASEAEITYESNKLYEDLYEDQISSVDMEIYLK
ncbi:hypothetical protein DV702_00300 [Sporosarcina sp. PTS2304]|uniref:hypothetical protein n=1 Tax=Sporosarcina sp. PTS2304 TaxID=2283194 RepID=UPI000E0D9F40|nr:hypothetical protein [Sporosarcina sp. PTS2304]AXH98277.1 hypothetical protein DV702_00300 [Sporosarcina sp. PTS2304]